MILNKIISFRTALHLSVVIALFQLIGWGLIAPWGLMTYNEIVLTCVVPFIVFLGLWLQSIFMSVLGVLWLLLWSTGLVWPLISSKQVPLVFASFLALSATLNLVTAGIILTKRVRAEFAYERAHQPKYKTYLRRILFGIAAGVMGIVSIIDVVNLAAK